MGWVMNIQPSGERIPITIEAVKAHIKPLDYKKSAGEKLSSLFPKGEWSTGKVINKLGTEVYNLELQLTEAKIKKFDLKGISEKMQRIYELKDIISYLQKTTNNKNFLKSLDQQAAIMGAKLRILNVVALEKEPLEKSEKIAAEQREKAQRKEAEKLRAPDADAQKWLSEMEKLGKAKLHEKTMHEAFASTRSGTYSGSWVGSMAETRTPSTVSPVRSEAPTPPIATAQAQSKAGTPDGEARIKNFISGLEEGLPQIEKILKDFKSKDETEMRSTLAALRDPRNMVEAGWKFLEREATPDALESVIKKYKPKYDQLMDLIGSANQHFRSLVIQREEQEDARAGMASVVSDVIAEQGKLEEAVKHPTTRVVVPAKVEKPAVFTFTADQFIQLTPQERERLLCQLIDRAIYFHRNGNNSLDPFLKLVRKKVANLPEASGQLITTASAQRVREIQSQVKGITSKSLIKIVENLPDYMARLKKATPGQLESIFQTLVVKAKELEAPEPKIEEVVPLSTSRRKTVRNAAVPKTVKKAPEPKKPQEGAAVRGREDLSYAEAIKKGEKAEPERLKSLAHLYDLTSNLYSELLKTEMEYIIDPEFLSYNPHNLTLKDEKKFLTIIANMLREINGDKDYQANIQKYPNFRRAYDAVEKQVFPKEVSIREELERQELQRGLEPVEMPRELARREGLSYADVTKRGLAAQRNEAMSEVVTVIGNFVSPEQAVRKPAAEGGALVRVEGRVIPVPVTPEQFATQFASSNPNTKIEIVYRLVNTLITLEREGNISLDPIVKVMNTGIANLPKPKASVSGQKITEDTAQLLRGIQAEAGSITSKHLLKFIGTLPDTIERLLVVTPKQMKSIVQAMVDKEGELTAKEKRLELKKVETAVPRETPKPKEIRREAVREGARLTYAEAAMKGEKAAEERSQIKELAQQAQARAAKAKQEAAKQAQEKAAKAKATKLKAATRPFVVSKEPFTVGVVKEEASSKGKKTITEPDRPLERGFVQEMEEGGLTFIPLVTNKEIDQAADRCVKAFDRLGTELKRVFNEIKSKKSYLERFQPDEPDSSILTRLADITSKFKNKAIDLKTALSVMEALDEAIECLEFYEKDYKDLYQSLIDVRNKLHEIKERKADSKQEYRQDIHKQLKKMENLLKGFEKKSLDECTRSLASVGELRVELENARNRCTEAGYKIGKKIEREFAMFEKRFDRCVKIRGAK